EMLPYRPLGRILTVFINNRECPYRCVFCGLWRDMLDETPVEGMVARQVERAIAEHPGCDAVKLYNAGSFFDERAIPPADREKIAQLCRHIRWVIVESRPELIDDRAVRFAEQLDGRLEIAIGVEVADDEIVAWLEER